MSLSFFESNKFDKKVIKSKVPWVDKYRPKKLDDIVQQDEIKNILKKSLICGNIPHLLLYGPPGTGKTSTILACCYELYGPKIFSDRVIELNASDERGINVVRTKITDFARKSLCNPDKAYPSPDFKIIILDEADAMTTEAQSALRKVIEEFSGTTRFCFICNYINQIIDPIISRCMKFRFKPILEKNILMKLEDICHKENFKLDNTILKNINNISKGDTRKSIMILQNLKYIYDFKKGNITKTDIYNITGYISEKLIEKVFLKCIHKDSKIEDIFKIVDFLKLKGYPVNSILFSLNKIILECKDLNDEVKSKIFYNLSITEKKLNDGADEYIQLTNIFSYIFNLAKYPDNNIDVDIIV
jgi:replication factor C subunit 2/4